MICGILRATHGRDFWVKAARSRKRKFNEFAAQREAFGDLTQEDLREEMTESSSLESEVWPIGNAHVHRKSIMFLPY